MQEPVLAGAVDYDHSEADARPPIKAFSRQEQYSGGLEKGLGGQLLDGDDDWLAVTTAVDEISYQGWAITVRGGTGRSEGLRDPAERFERITLC